MGKDTFHFVLSHNFVSSVEPNGFSSLITAAFCMTLSWLPSCCKHWPLGRHCCRVWNQTSLFLVLKSSWVGSCWKTSFWINNCDVPIIPRSGFLHRDCWNTCLLHGFSHRRIVQLHNRNEKSLNALGLIPRHKALFELLFGNKLSSCHRLGIFSRDSYVSNFLIILEEDSSVSSLSFIATCLYLFCILEMCCISGVCISTFTIKMLYIEV